MRSFLALTMLASTAALAELPTLQVNAGYSSQVFAHRAFDFVATADAVHFVRAAAGAGFTLPLGVLDLEGGYTGGQADGATRGNQLVQLRLNGALLGATWRVPVFRWLQPYVHLGGGLEWVTLSLGGARLTQTVVTASGTGLLGVQAVVPLGRKVPRRPELVFDLGAGAVLRPDLQFNAVAPPQPKPAPEDPIASGSVDLGRMPLSGFTLRVLAGFRY